MVAFSHHQKQDVADFEGVSFPHSGDRKRTPLRVDAGHGGVLSQRVNPFLELSLDRFSGAAYVVISEDVIDLFPTMVPECTH
jgi:hypothetical protein